MSLHIEFDAHSWYKSFAIEKSQYEDTSDKQRTVWRGYTDNGNTYRVDTVVAPTLKELKQEINAYHIRQRNGYAERMRTK